MDVTAGGFEFPLKSAEVIAAESAMQGGTVTVEQVELLMAHSIVRMDALREAAARVGIVMPPTYTGATKT